MSVTLIECRLQLAINETIIQFINNERIESLHDTIFPDIFQSPFQYKYPNLSVG